MYLKCALKQSVFEQLLFCFEHCLNNDNLIVVSHAIHFCCSLAILLAANNLKDHIIGLDGSVITA